ncbi:MAG: hypothetical protein K6346_06490, partial [Halothiobacillaceae bacterium]
MLKKGFPALFQLCTSRSAFATARKHQSLGATGVRASHPWLAQAGLSASTTISMSDSVYPAPAGNG